MAVYAEPQHSEAEAVRLVLLEASLDNIVKPKPNPLSIYYGNRNLAWPDVCQTHKNTNL